MWAVMQCHRIMTESMVVQFEGHPAIVKEISLFIITERVDLKEMEALLELVKKVESERNLWGTRMSSFALTCRS
jgi:hypothetical protein